VLAVGLVVVWATGLLFVSSALGQQQPPPQPSPRGQQREQQCAAALPRQAVEAILANHREPLRAAREAMATQERALRTLLVADNTTRAALDAQIARTNDARNAFARARMNALWDLRSVIPAQDRQVAFRCAERLLFRGNR
jgi:Spy/CpxP family protein refolding chaperone